VYIYIYIYIYIYQYDDVSVLEYNKVKTVTVAVFHVLTYVFRPGGLKNIKVAPVSIWTFLPAISM